MLMISSSLHPTCSAPVGILSALIVSILHFSTFDRYDRNDILASSKYFISSNAWNVQIARKPPTNKNKRQGGEREREGEEVAEKIIDYSLNYRGSSLQKSSWNRVDVFLPTNGLMVEVFPRNFMCRLLFLWPMFRYAWNTKNSIK